MDMYSDLLISDIYNFLSSLQLSVADEVRCEDLICRLEEEGFTIEGNKEA